MLRRVSHEADHFCSRHRLAINVGRVRFPAKCRSAHVKKQAAIKTFYGPLAVLVVLIHTASVT